MGCSIAVPFVHRITKPVSCARNTVEGTIGNDCFPYGSRPVDRNAHYQRLTLCIVFRSPLGVLYSAPNGCRQRIRYASFVANVPAI